MMTKVLSAEDYKEKAYQFIRGDLDRKTLLRKWEIEYLEINESFHFYLAEAIDYYILKEYEFLYTISAPKMTFKELQKSLNNDSINRYQAYKNFIYQRGLSIAYEKELGFDLVGIVKPIVESHVKRYSYEEFDWSRELKECVEKCKLQFERLQRLKSELPESLFKAEIKLEVIDLEKENEGKEDNTFIKGVLIDFTKKMFPEIEQPLYIEKPKNTSKAKPIKYNFDTIFISEESKLMTLEAAKRLSIINEHHNWIYKNKKGAIIAIIDVLKHRGYLKDLKENQLANIFADKFNTTISDRTTRNRPIYYDKLVKCLKSLIK